MICRARAATKGSAIPSGTQTWSGATQVCPALRNLPQAMRAAASSTSASGARITGDLPPSSRVTGVRCSAAAAMTLFPTAGLPVKKITSKGLSTRASASSRPPSATVI